MVLFGGRVALSEIMTHSWVFLTHSIVSSCGVRSFFFFLSFFPWGWEGGLSWGNCPLNFKWHYRETQKWAVVLCFVWNAVLTPLTLSSSVFWSCRWPGSPVTLASDQASWFALYLFFSLFSFLGGITCWCCVFMDVLTIFMVEEFYIYAVVQFYFFLQEKSVMYEINQSHLFEK